MVQHDSRFELDRIRDGLVTVAVTGTNGKTTTASMIAGIVEAAGEPAVLVNTLGMWVAGVQIADDNSMASFIRTLKRAREVGAHTVALEVTSRALASGFAGRWPPQVAVLTNFSADHMDLHGTAEHYLAAKAQLFVKLPPKGTAVLNAADPASGLLADVVRGDVGIRGFHAAPGAPAFLDSVRLAADRIEEHEGALQLSLSASPLSDRLGGDLTLRVAGSFHADNALAAAVAADAIGCSEDAITRGLARFAGVPGRFEVIAREPLFVVDFAHTPDALRRVLQSARVLARRRSGRVGCVFGCGGERDPHKRPIMGAIADDLADAVWLTTDNPRSEPPEEIAAQVRIGARGNAVWSSIAQRACAIMAAACWARSADVVIVAGRGHERVQQLADGPVPCSDRELAAAALNSCPEG